MKYFTKYFIKWLTIIFVINIIHLYETRSYKFKVKGLIFMARKIPQIFKKSSLYLSTMDPSSEDNLKFKKEMLIDGYLWESLCRSFLKKDIENCKLMKLVLRKHYDPKNAELEQFLDDTSKNDNLLREAMSEVITAFEDSNYLKKFLTLYTDAHAFQKFLWEYHEMILYEIRKYKRNFDYLDKNDYDFLIKLVDTGKLMVDLYVDLYCNKE